MKKLIMCKGLPASGKSTWARLQIKKAPTNSIKRVNKDDLRDMLDNGKHSKGNESHVLAIRDIIIKRSLINGSHVIVDDTNLHPKHEEALRELAKERHAQFIIEDFTHVPLKECIVRNETRACTDAYVPEKVIRSMSREYLTPTKPEVNLIPKVDGLPSCIICDLDGTLAIHTDRSPYDQMKCYSDDVNQQVLQLINNYPIDLVIFMSGRPDDSYLETMRWLGDKCNIPNPCLFMRKAGDMRKDYTVKKELYMKHIQGKYNVEFCLDDRNQVVELWRELGLQCFQVADGNF